jgi:hypothetical protein
MTVDLQTLDAALIEAKRQELKRAKDSPAAWFTQICPSIRMSTGLEQEPSAALGLINPIFYQAGTGDVAQFIDH